MANYRESHGAAVVPFRGKLQCARQGGAWPLEAECRVRDAEQEHAKLFLWDPDPGKAERHAEEAEGAPAVVGGEILADGGIDSARQWPKSRNWTTLWGQASPKMRYRCCNGNIKAHTTEPSSGIEAQNWIWCDEFQAPYIVCGVKILHSLPYR